MRTNNLVKKSAENAPSPKIAIAIMAAGKGTRLKSRHPKVLHRAGGKCLLEHVIAAATRVVAAADVYVIVGHEAERVQDAVRSTGVRFVVQQQQRGTGHAIMVARTKLASYDYLLVLSGDAPLIQSGTIHRLLHDHLQQRAAMTILTAEPPDPTGYGRVIRRRKSGKISSEVAAIVEHKSATPAQLKVREINSGIYAFDTKALFGHIDEISTNNPHGEYYLTDMACILVNAGLPVMACPATDAHEVLGANTRSELAELDAYMRRQKTAELMANGVTIYLPETCVIDTDVTVEPDTVIDPFVQLVGQTHVGADTYIQSFNVIKNCEIGDNVLVQSGCVLEHSVIAAKVSLGPFTHLRPGNEVAEGAHIGNFVELKKTRLGKGSKANHLTYLGDSVIGEKVNVGAGTITCNYDGFSKHQTVIGDGSFIGSDATLVAPIRVGKRAYIGAASCVTEDVPDDALAIGRGRQVNKEGWAREKREKLTAARKQQS